MERDSAADISGSFRGFLSSAPPASPGTARQRCWPARGRAALHSATDPAKGSISPALHALGCSQHRAGRRWCYSQVPCPRLQHNLYRDTHSSSPAPLPVSNLSVRLHLKPSRSQQSPWLRVRKITQTQAMHLPLSHNTGHSGKDTSRSARPHPQLTQTAAPSALPAARRANALRTRRICSH